MRDGINLMDLELEEQALQRQLEASLSGIICKILMTSGTMISTNGTTFTPYAFPSQALSMEDSAHGPPVESLSGDSQART